LPLAAADPNEADMTKRVNNTGKAVIAGAIGSAAVAAALLYVGRRKKKHQPQQPGPIPSGEPPETD
jgi:LPXTG-motif cell wall-anchored protein